MVIIPREKPVIENLNVYYLDIKKLLEHYQGEIGSGGVYFKSHAAEGVIFFDKDDLLNAIYEEKEIDLTGAEAVEHLLNAGGQSNFTVNIYQLSLDEVYFWASIPSAEKIYEGLSTEFTDIEGLIRKMSSEKLTGYIDVAIGNAQEGGLIFIINGKIMGGSYSWGNGEPGPSKKNQELLIRKTKESGATFNVCRIPLSKMKAEGESRTTYTRPSQAILIMLEELMVIFETAVLSQKRMKTDFNKLLKKKFVENAEKYAFMDPFADGLNCFGFQAGQSIDDPGHGRGRVETGQRHGPMTHASVDGKPGSQSTFLGDADQSVLGFADDRRRHRIGMAAGDEMPHTGHHALFVAQYPTHD